MHPDPSSGLARSEGARLLALYAAGRISAGTATFALLLTGKQLSGGLGSGALAVAGYTAAVALSGPLIARRADRWGPRRVLRGLSWGFGVALVVTAAAAGLGSWALVVGATVSGTLMPPLGPAVRATLTQMYPNQRSRSRVLTAESVLLETITLLGPLIVVALAVASPRLGLVAAAVGAVVGGTGLSRSDRLLLRAPGASTTRSLRTVLHRPVLVLLATLMAMTGALSALEVAIVAFSSGRASWLPGVLLALLAAGSIVGGLLVVARPLPGRATVQLPLLLLILAIGAAALTQVHTAIVFGVVLSLTAMVVSPTSAALMTALGAVADPGQVTETFGWAGSANYVGIAAWTGAAGWLSEAAGTSGVLLLVVASSALGALLIPAVRQHPRPARQAPMPHATSGAPAR